MLQILHLRFFTFQRRSTHSNTLPLWLSAPEPGLLRRFVRSGKHGLVVDKLELMDINPTYANIRYLDGRESTVLVRDLAPFLDVNNVKASIISDSNQLPAVIKRLNMFCDKRTVCLL